MVNKSVCLIYDDIFLEHRSPRGHPERPERLKIALRSIKEHNLPVDFVKPIKGEISIALRVHDKGYVSHVTEMLKRAFTFLDPDTYLSEGSLKAILHALGGSIQSADLAFSENKTIFLMPRPPGHHAGIRGRAMGAPTLGFCVFNNIAVVIHRLLEKGVKRILVIDFDAHHGNGTQEIFYKNPNVVHIDLHQDPFTLYPGTGFIYDIGEEEAEGTKVNIVLPPGSGDDAYEIAIREIIEPIISQFKPDAIVYSAGFDAYLNDGLASLRMSSNSLHKLASLSSNVNILVAVLEGGYSAGLRRGVPAFVSGLLGIEDPIKDEKTTTADISTFKRDLRSLKDLLSTKWSF